MTFLLWTLLFFVEHAEYAHTHEGGKNKNNVRWWPCWVIENLPKGCLQKTAEAASDADVHTEY